MSLVVPFEEIFADKTGILAEHGTWERVDLGAACEILNGFPFNSSLFNTEKGIPVIRIRDLSNNTTETLYDGDFPKEYIVHKGDLLIGMDGIFRCIEWRGENAGLNQRVCRIIPNEQFLNSKLLLYGINGYLKAIQDATSSVTVGHLSSKDILRIPFPLPPLNEQHRIVVKLEKLLGKVDACQKRLEKIPLILKRFRQSVLAAACSGRLTEDWREENDCGEDASSLVLRLQEERKAKFEKDLLLAHQTRKKSPKAPANNFIPVIEISENLPDRWRITRIGDVSECLDHLRIPINKNNRMQRSGTIPYYGANGQVGWIDDYLFDEELVLLVEDETFIGREKPFSYVIRGKCWVNNHAHVLRPLPGISAEYLNICWSYYDFTSLTSGTTGRRKLTQEALINASFGFAPLAEQQEIVWRVKELFKFADQIEARYQKAKAHVDKLTQSILAKAFRGELVPQDPDDEPASVLLERIRRERGHAESAMINSKGGKRNARKSRVLQTA